MPHVLISGSWLCGSCRFRFLVFFFFLGTANLFSRVAARFTPCLQCMCDLVSLHHCQRLLWLLAWHPSCRLKGRAAEGFQATGRKDRLQEC